MNLKAINTYSYEKNADKMKNTGISGTESSGLFTFKNDVENTSSTTKDVSDNYTFEMASMVSFATKMSDNVDILSKLNANGLTSIALNSSSKAYSVINSVKSAIGSYASQISMISNNPFLSEDEKKSKIRLLEAKIKACADEGNNKVSTLYNISEIIVSLASTYTALQDMGVDTNEMTSMFSQMISNVNTQPSDFSAAANKNDLSDIVKNNEQKLFGQNSKQMFSGFIDKTDKNIKENEEKLKNKDLTPEEEKRLKLELIIYKSEKNLFVSLSK